MSDVVLWGNANPVRRAEARKAASEVVTPKTTINFAYVAYAFKKGFRYCCLEGSSRSGKTWAILQWLVLSCLEPKTFIKGYERDSLEVRCLRHDATTSRATIWGDLQKIIDSLGLKEGPEGLRLNRRDMEITFPNGSKIMFGGANDPGKLHGVGSDIVFFNEAMMISRAAVDQMEMRTRVGFIFDWNPSLNEHWIFKQGFDRTCYYAADEKMAGEPKVFYAHSTYKDNLDNLTPGQIASIEQFEMTPGNVERGTANQHMWDIYGLGKRGYLEGRIITPERVVMVEDGDFPTSKQWEAHGYGLDWGFSADPTALVECAIFDKKLYVRELIYRKGLLPVPNPTLPGDESVLELLKELEVRPYDVIVADSARSDLNAQLRASGYCCVDAYKPYGGSIEPGIALMNQRRWCVTDGSYNIKFELENWCWKHDRYGNQMTKPGDKHNHAMDAIRYWLQTFVNGNETIKVRNEGDEEKQWGCSMDLW